MNLTPKEKEIYDALRNGHDENYGDREGWIMVYLDNEIPMNKSTAGILASLTKKGLYEIEDGYAFGWVKT